MGQQFGISKKIYFRCPENYKNEFSVSKCSVTISIGNQAQESEVFFATISLINKTFMECTIMVCDTLQRHTMKIYNNSFDIVEQAKKDGDEWLKRNELALSQLTIPNHIIRWEKWLLHKDYPEERKKIDDLYEKNQVFRKAFKEAAVSYLVRLKKRTDLFDYENALKFCIEYLKEECAAMLLWSKEPYNFEIYPSKRNLAMNATYKFLIEPIKPHLLRPIFLEIRSKNDVNATSQR